MELVPLLLMRYGRVFYMRADSGHSEEMNHDDIS